RAGQQGARRLLDQEGRAALGFGPDVDRAAPDAGTGCVAEYGAGSGGQVTAMAASDTTGVRMVVEVLARALTDRPDEVRVTESQHKHKTLIELFVSPADIGKVIGRQGRTAAALRTLAATAGEREGKDVTLEIRESRRN